jgi:hypothetical protein
MPHTAQCPARSSATPPAGWPWPTLSAAASLLCLLVFAPGVGASALSPAVGASAPRASAVEATPTALRARIQALVGVAPCTTDADCRTSAIGAKACGGPEAYIAWSTRLTDEAALGSALAEYSAAQRTAITREGRVSTCEFVTDPGAVCVASGAAGGSCRLRQRAGRSGSPSSR